MTMKISRARVTHNFLWVTIGWAVTAIVGLAIIGTTVSTHAAPTGQSRGSTALPDMAHPLVNGQETTVQAAQAAVGFQVPVPDIAAASTSNLTKTWLDSSQQLVALVFDDGKLTIMMGPASYQDATSEFKTFIAENDANASIGQVNGQPALIIEPGTDTEKSNPAWVEFDHNGIDINLVSNSYGTDTLLAVANSMK